MTVAPRIPFHHHQGRWTIAIYFDGGAAKVGSKQPWVGAGVSAWVVRNDGLCLPLFDLALPVLQGKHSADAEAFAATAALHCRALARATVRDMGIECHPVELLRGDNSCVVAYLAGTGRIRASGMRQILQGAATRRVLMGMYEAQYIPRCLNTHADRQATAGLNISKWIITGHSRPPTAKSKAKPKKAEERKHWTKGCHMQGQQSLAIQDGRGHDLHDFWAPSIQHGGTEALRLRVMGRPRRHAPLPS